MVPRHVVVLDRFPLLSSGKADRKMLLAILEAEMNGQSPEVMTP
jgi:hypothetical protein